MLNKEKLEKFLLKARTKTYVGKGGKVKSVFGGSKQLEYQEGNWLYRDIYFNGPKIFMGIETVYFKEKAVFAMSYFGDYSGMTEREIDKILRKALMVNWQVARTWKIVNWQENGYQYSCVPAFKGSIEKMAGKEEILEKGKQVYQFFYAGGILN